MNYSKCFLETLLDLLVCLLKFLSQFCFMSVMYVCCWIPNIVTLTYDICVGFHPNFVNWRIYKQLPCKWVVLNAEKTVSTYLIVRKMAAPSLEWQFKMFLTRCIDLKRLILSDFFTSSFWIFAMHFCRYNCE